MTQTVPPPLPVPSGTPLPSRELVTHQQFQTVLDVLGSLQPFLLLTQREMELGIPKELEGGIVASAATTFIKACDRLDTMLDDQSRWKLKENDELYAAMTAHYVGMSKVNEEQLKTFAQVQRPSHRLKPSVTTINGEFISFWGSPKLPGGLVLGRGPTPEEALKDFDIAFSRKVDEQLRFAPASEERIAAEPVEAKKKKRSKRKSGY